MSDLYVVHECEDLDRVEYPKFERIFTSHIWKGQNKSKGIGVFCTVSTTVEALELDDTGVELFLPCKTNLGFNVLAVWTKDKSNIGPSYIGQFLAYYERHREIFEKDHWLILGDFNSNAIWDKQYKPGHSFVVSELQKDNYISVYHNSGEAEIIHGAEETPTLYMHRNRDKPYHVDYVFSNSDSDFYIQDLNVCDYSAWGEISDHMPLHFNVIKG